MTCCTHNKALFLASGMECADGSGYVCTGFKTSPGNNLDVYQQTFVKTFVNIR